MNLGKLLGAGKSFFGGNGVVAYRENKRVYLPKFNSPKNPFTSKPAAAAPAVPGAAVKSRTALAPAVARPVRATNWAEKLNPFRAPQPTRLAPVLAVQTELSLEAVKVVHNDLADADIEVVPVKSRTAAPVEAPALSPARRSWDFMSEQLAETT